MKETYIGRFAPTPSGHLHFGSIIAATGSYLFAKHHQGKFLIRIEDLDKERCKKEYTTSILEDLKTLGFISDTQPLIQSTDTTRYESACCKLLETGFAFYCRCTRSELKKRPCTCYKKDYNKDDRASLRFYHKDLIEDYFVDDILGKVCIAHDSESFITLKRADGFYSYNLACVIDDIYQSVNHIVRGSDLIDVTPIQNALYKALGCDHPHYAHLPLALNANCDKLSKQNHAKAALSYLSPQKALLLAMSFLGQDISEFDESMEPCAILDKASKVFSVRAIPLRSKIVFQDKF